MGTLIEEFNAMKIQVAAAVAKGDQATLQKKIHVVDHEAERERKASNPSKSTRVSLNCRTPEQWSEFQMEKERYIDIAVDPHIAIDLMLKALRSYSEATIRAWVSGGYDQPGPQPPKAEIPDLPAWLREAPSQPGGSKGGE